jgi:hypothetical protein
MPADLGECGGELQPALDRVRALAGLGLDELADDPVTLARGEPSDGDALRVNPQTRATLFASGDPEVGDQRLEYDGDPIIHFCILSIE